jgi:glycosyltransferase involved in cell wall biosynthesis
VQNSMECELHVYGAARYLWDRTYLEESMGRYRGAAKINLYGSIPPDQLSRAYGHIDVLVVPSLLPEAFGFVVAEAFSAKRPVIVFDSGALPELVTDGVNGFIVRRKDSESLAAAMQLFIDNKDLAVQMTEGMPQPKTIQEYTDEVMDVYDSTMTKNAVCSVS